MAILDVHTKFQGVNTSMHTHLGVIFMFFVAAQFQTRHHKNKNKLHLDLLKFGGWNNKDKKSPNAGEFHGDLPMVESVKKTKLP